MKVLYIPEVQVRNQNSVLILYLFVFDFGQVSNTPVDFAPG